MNIYTVCWFLAVGVLIAFVSFILGMAYQIRLHDDAMHEARSRRHHPAGSNL